MKVQKINDLKVEFLRFLEKEDHQHIFLLRKAIQNWQNNFDNDSEALDESIDRALNTKIAGRLWEGEHNSMKSGLLMLHEINPMFFKATIEDLYNENMDISMRLNRYIFHCDQIFDEVKHNTKKISTHHQDYYTGSLLASLQMPHLYTPFQYAAYKKLMHFLESNNIPLEQEIVRYMKTLRNLSTIISKDEEFMQTYFQYIPQDGYIGPSNALSYELMLFLENKK